MCAHNGIIQFLREMLRVELCGLCINQVPVLVLFNYCEVLRQVIITVYICLLLHSVVV